MISRQQVNPWLVLSALALIASVGVILINIPPLLVAALGPGTGDAEPKKVVANLLDDSTQDFRLYQDRFNGRSFFFKPPPWPRPRKPVASAVPTPTPRPETPTVPTKPSGPPPPPATYQGPPVIFVVGNEVWFKPVRAEESSLRVSVGQEKDGIQVISTSLPWSVKVGYLGGEYDIELFPKASDSLFASAAPAMTVTPGLVDANPEGPLDTPSGPEKVADDKAVAPSGPADGADDLKTTENEDEDEGAAAKGTENASDPLLAEPTPTGDGEGESAEAAKADSGSPLDTGGPESVEDAMEGPPADNAEQKLAISEETVSTQVEEEPADVKVKSEAEK